jgi:5-methylcytosine-specific restriction protein A
MSDGLDIEHLKRKLEGRFQLALSFSQEAIDGGQFDIIRPTDLELGNGFGIVVSRTHRQLEASFKADNFAGALLRRMSESDVQARAQFARVREDAMNAGSQVYVAVDSTPVNDLSEMHDPWRRLDLDVTRRFPLHRVSADQALELALNVTSSCLSLALSLLPLDSPSEGMFSTAEGMPEGALIKVEVNRYERSPVNRAACLAHFGTQCQCCGFDFATKYGDLGEGYIEVHHRVPVSQMGDGYVVDPIRDLVPLCGNCHSMVHRVNPPLAVEELKMLVAHAAAPVVTAL